MENRFVWILFCTIWLIRLPAFSQQGSGGEKVFFYHHDHLGNTVCVTDEVGEVVQHVEYLPTGEVFIEEKNPASTYATSYKFNGKELDEETGLYYYGARYLHPKYGMWLSTDPMEGKYPHINTYCYVNNNPIKFIDIDGRDGLLTGSGTAEDPYIITAIYYYEKGTLDFTQIKGLNKAINDYNNYRKPRRIKNDKGDKLFVLFNLSIKEVEEVTSEIVNNVIRESNSETYYFGNILGTRPIDRGKTTELGSANGWRIDLNPLNIKEYANNNGISEVDVIRWTYVHEIGHNLGLDHSMNTSIMQCLNVSSNTNSLGIPQPPIISHPIVDNKGVKILLNSINMPRVNSLGILWTK
ncbi:MAG: hypothetical protein IJ624_04005 [Prevotella sp.]|nr:hypothetical protein [Prevotella sp.]